MNCTLGDIDFLRFRIFFGMFRDFFLEIILVKKGLIL